MRLRTSFLAILAALVAAPVARAEDPAARVDGAAPAEPAAETPPAAEDEVNPDDLYVYSVDRVPQRVFDVARQVMVITGDDLRRKNPRSLPEALMGEVGLFVQQTDYRAGSPIIRGLMGKQVLIMVDGVKVNNATYRYGPNQYLATIDLQMVDRIEVVEGVGSVLGSDALGGAINVIMKKGPGDGVERTGGAVRGRFSSADESLLSSVEAYTRKGPMRAIAHGTFSTLSDVEIGSDVLQPGTGQFDEKSASARVEWFASEAVSVAGSYQFLQQDNVPRTDRYNDGWIKYEYTPQRMQLATLTLSDQTPRLLSERSQVTLYFNRQDESVQEIKSSAPSTERQFVDADTMLGLNAEVFALAGEAHEIVYGVDYSHEWIDSARQDLNLTTSVLTPKVGRYADGSTYDTAALYAQDRWKATRWLSLTLGARGAYFGADGTQQTPVGNVPFTLNTWGLAGSLSAVASITPQLNAVASVTSGFRGPNIDDVSAWVEESGYVEVPAGTGLKPERIMNYELGFKFRNSRFTGSAFAYYAALSDLLVRAPSTFRGLPFLDSNGNGVQDPGELRIEQKQNIGEAAIYGASGRFRLRVRDDLTLYGNITYTRGDDTLNDVPLTRIPPLNGAGGVIWSPKVRWNPWIEANVLVGAAQTRLGPGDITDTRIGPNGTDAYQAVTIRGGISVNHLQLTAGVENIFDETYKYHGSGAYRPGRQIVLGAEIRM